MASAWPSANGTFQIADVPPGTYRIIAVDKPPRGFVELQRDALEWLSLSGTPVTVAADRPSTVNLALTHLP
jgi:hypothetical protein